jgi:trk system potassium uptake protein TrkA
MQKLELGDAEVGILARILRKVDFFSPLTVGQLDQVLPHVRLYAFDAGETVFKQGEAGDAFYIVYKGKVSVRIKKGFLSFSKTVAALGEGSFFGEMALLTKEPRSATVVSEEPTQLFVLIATDFQFVLQENPATASEMKRIADRRKFESAHTAK